MVSADESYDRSYSHCNTGVDEAKALETPWTNAEHFLCQPRTLSAAASSLPSPNAFLQQRLCSETLRWGMLAVTLWLIQQGSVAAERETGMGTGGGREGGQAAATRVCIGGKLRGCAARCCGGAGAREKCKRFILETCDVKNRK